jgi:hypothetical protein
MSDGTPGDEGRDRTADVLPPSVRDTSSEPPTEILRLDRAAMPIHERLFMPPAITCAHTDVAVSLQSLIRGREGSPTGLEPESSVVMCDSDPEVIVSTRDGKLAFCHIHLRDAADALARDRARTVAASPTRVA